MISPALEAEVDVDIDTDPVRSEALEQPETSGSMLVMLRREKAPAAERRPTTAIPISWARCTKSHDEEVAGAGHPADDVELVIEARLDLGDGGIAPSETRDGEIAQVVVRLA
jgi:hypothetical protein